MTRSRLVVLSSLTVASVGAMLALGALLLGPARASVGPLPAEALVLPADTTFIVGLDVKRFTSSPFYQKYGHRGEAGHPQAFAELEEKTGLNPQRDLDLVVIAGSKAAGREGSGLVFVTGTFDRYKLGRAIETQQKGTTWKKEQGTTVYFFKEGAKGGGALAFLDDHTLVVGDQRAVESTVAGHAQGGKALRSNAALMELLGKVKPGSTFWMVGDQSLLASLPKTMPAPGAGGSDAATTVALPALKSLTVTGDLDPDLAVEITGFAADEAAAKNLADVVRGFVALAALQANQKPELKPLASAINVTTENSQVHVNARVPYALLDALQPKKQAPAPEAPAAK